MRPPYVSGLSSGDGEGVALAVDFDTGIVEVAVRGTWGRQLHRETTAAIRKCLSEHPTALIVDLLAMSDERAVSVATWITACRIAESINPPVRIIGCVPPETALAARLRRLGMVRHLPLHDTVAAARGAAARGLSLTDRVRLHLTPEVMAPALARNLVTDACAAWDLNGLLHPGRLVMSELAANAVMHARTPFTVAASRRGGGLHLSVKDGSRAAPRVVDDEPAARDSVWALPRRGLHIVHGAAHTWGWLPVADGKIVWAILRGPAGVRRSGSP